jgi:hypothetical protein
MKPQNQSEVDTFFESRCKLEEIIAWLQSSGAPMTHADVERGIRDRSWELLRSVEQGFLDQRFERELAQAATVPTQAGVTVRVRERRIEGEFGRVTHRRLGYARAGQPSELPADAELNLPAELYSLEVRQRAAFEAQHSCWTEVVESVDRNSGAHVPKRQAQQLAARASQDFDAFYELTSPPTDDTLSNRALEVASCDSKGVTMLDQGLRDETRKAADNAKADAVRGDPMAPKKLRRHDKRMAIVTANWEQERQPRTAEQVLANLDRVPGQSKPKGTRPHNKRVRASVEKTQAEGIAEMFDEIERRNPLAERTTVVLVDGEERQLAEIKRQAEQRAIAIRIVLDLIHVIHYLWIAGAVLCGKDAKRTEAWVREYLERLLTGPASYVAASIRRQATMLRLTTEQREPVDTCCNYLLKNQAYLRYAEYLAEGFPIATGLIEGACRHLVQDRMGITGARWDVPGAEHVLKLRALRCSGDWDDYWTFHEQQEFTRNYERRAA